MGAGNSKSQQIKNFNKFTTETIFKSMTEVNNSCSQSVTTDQTLNIELDGHASAAAACKAGNLEGEAYVDCLAALNKVGQDVNISGIFQDASIVAVANCSFTTEQAEQINKKVAQKLMQQGRQQEDGVTEIAKTLLKPLQIGNKENKDQINETDVTNILNTHLDSKFYNTVAQNVKANQLLDIVSKGGFKSTNIKDITQEVKITAIKKAFSKNSKIIQNLDKIDKEIIQKAETVTDFLGGNYQEAMMSSVCSLIILGATFILALIYDVGGQVQKARSE